MFYFFIIVINLFCLFFGDVNLLGHTGNWYGNKAEWLSRFLYCCPFNCKTISCCV